jgi:RNA polymerase subunit RPABC4/transcription elongation factor Spt4
MGDLGIGRVVDLEQVPWKLARNSQRGRSPLRSTENDKSEGRWYNAAYFRDEESTNRMDFEQILSTIQPFVIMFAALFAAFLTATWISSVIWAFRDIRARSRDIFAQILATLMVLIFFPLFPVPGLVLYFILRPRETLAEIYERSLEEEALLQGIEERMACPGCNRRIEEEFMICPTCHTRLKKGCPTCGRLLHLRWNICPYCGAVQTAAKAAPPPSQPEVRLVEPTLEMPRLSSAAAEAAPEPVWEVEEEPIEEIEPEPGPEPELEPELEPEPEDSEGDPLPFDFE